MNYKNVQKLIVEAYFPSLEIIRHICLPLDTPRGENDSEHSFSLALVGSALAEKLGLDAGKVALYATYHDLLEIYSGDTSIWDKKGYETKLERERIAVLRIEKEFANFPLIPDIVKKYESLFDEEARFVYALDKLLPLIIHLQTKGQFWRQNKITFEKHLAKTKEVRLKVSKHDKVLEWFDQALKYSIEHKDILFFKD
jgi:putative hydrolase of HD superfamily